MEKTYKERYEKARKQITSRNQFFKKKALKYQASVTRCVQLEDEYAKANAQLNQAIKARNVAQIAEQLWHDNKIILAILLEQRAREAELDLSLSTVDLM